MRSIRNTFISDNEDNLVGGELKSPIHLDVMCFYYASICNALHEVKGLATRDYSTALFCREN